jgi:hypothetical protein
MILRLCRYLIGGNGMITREQEQDQEDTQAFHRTGSKEGDMIMAVFPETPVTGHGRASCLLFL